MKNLKIILTKKFLVEQYSILEKSIIIIAKEIGCSEWSVRFYLNRYNIKIRTKSESHKGMKGLKHAEKSKQKIRESHLGEKAYNFKGRTKNTTGYILIYSSNHPYKNFHNNVKEQRLVVEKELGRYLDPKWVVHHINKIRDDNCIENLICFVNQSAHLRFHGNPKNVKKSEIVFDGRIFKGGIRWLNHI